MKKGSKERERQECSTPVYAHVRSPLCRRPLFMHVLDWERLVRLACTFAFDQAM